MLKNSTPAHAPSRRELLSSAAATVAAAMAVSVVSARAAPKLVSLDPVDPDIYFGTTGSYFGSWPNGSLKMSDDMPMMLAEVKNYGLQGLEPYAIQVVPFLDNPAKLKAMADAEGVRIVDVGDLPPHPNATTSAGREPASAPAYPWLGEAGNAELINDMVQFARDFLGPLGCDHWKTNMGARPLGGPSDRQLRELAKTLNRIGSETIKYGVRLSPHPHIWGPMEREHDLRTVMDNTDPRYVWMILDTGHNVLGGMNPAKILQDYFPRISELHLKDTYPEYIGNTATPTQEQHRKKSLYSSLGAGGVDFPAIFKVLRERHFKGWAVFDIDAPRPGDGTGSVDDNIRASVNYMRNVLKVNLPPPPRRGLFKETQ